MHRIKASSMDSALETAFGQPVEQLYQAVAADGTAPALARALELRACLALTEEQVARVRDRVHAAMAADRDMGELSAGALRYDAQSLEAALEARGGYRAALGELLRTMPSPVWLEPPVRTAQLRVTASTRPAVRVPACLRSRPPR